MEKNTKIIIGILVVLVVAVVLFRGQITGKATSRYCSDIPEITSFKRVGDMITVDWTDTSIFTGQIKYEALLFKQQEDGTYDYSNPYRTEYTKNLYGSFSEVVTGTYIVLLRAKNKVGCSEEYSDYNTQELTITDLIN